MKLDDARVQYECRDGILYAEDLQDGTLQEIGIYELRSQILHIRLTCPTMIYPGLTPAIMSVKLGQPVSGVAIGLI